MEQHEQSEAELDRLRYIAARCDYGDLPPDWLDTRVVPDYPRSWDGAGVLWGVMAAAECYPGLAQGDTGHYASLHNVQDREVSGSMAPTAPHAITLVYIDAAKRGWLGEETQKRYEEAEAEWKLLPVKV